VSARSKNAGHFPEDGGCILDKAKDGNRNHDVELFGGKWRVLRRCDPKFDIDVLTRGPLHGGFDHCRRGIDPDDMGAALCEVNGEIAITAPDIQNAPIANLADQV
jgi:hypothetical protein